MRYLLDTNICIYLIKKQFPDIIPRLLQVGFDKVAISSITIAELEYGVANSSKSQQAQLALLQFIIPFEIIDFTVDAASWYGRIRKELKTKGLPIGAMDMLIAAIALANDLSLVTNNEREFRRIAGLKIENWASPGA
jgi:tRNA(fMet)-specific endonuclease VapC